jgi:hypothetical protein
MPKEDVNKKLKKKDKKEETKQLSGTPPKTCRRNNVLKSQPPFYQIPQGACVS